MKPYDVNKKIGLPGLAGGAHDPASQVARAKEPRPETTQGL
jgi:hypothetical protein